MLVKALLFFTLLATAHGAASREKLLKQEAASIRTARKVVADEFAGYHQGNHKPLNTATLLPSDVDELANIIQGPEMAVKPTTEELYGCFVPHHSFLVTDRKGKSYEILVCLDCQFVVFRQGPHGTSFPFTKAARGRLLMLFRHLKLPNRKPEEYSMLDWDEDLKAK